VVCADAVTGETLWLYHGNDTAERGAVRPNNRGLSYWSDGKGDDRILFVTPGYQLVALNAKSGSPIANFGADAHVDLWKGLDRTEVKKESIGATSPPIIVRDVAVVGAALKVGVSLPTKLNTPGYIRGYDVRTGKLLWTFHTVPQAGEFGIRDLAEGSADRHRVVEVHGQQTRSRNHARTLPPVHCWLRKRRTDHRLSESRDSRGN
jgi:quinoprotein glucose dehydrogenase